MVAPAEMFFSVEQESTISVEIQTLIQKGAVSLQEPHQVSFVSQLFLAPEKDGDFRPVVNLKALNILSRKNTSRWRVLHGERSDETGRLVSQDRFKGCILPDPSASWSPEVSAVHLESEPLPISLPSFQTVMCTTSIHKGYETSAFLSDCHVHHEYSQRL